MRNDINETHDRDRTSWVESANGHSEFPIQNLPLGMFSPPGGTPRAGVAIGDSIVDLAALAVAGLIDGEAAGQLVGATLNGLLGLPAQARSALRLQLSRLLSDPAHRPAVEPHLHLAADCALHLPATIGDYTDFFVGIHHAVNAGKLFRPDNPLLPNYKYVPIGYHGRASSVQPSDAPVRRPHGQVKPSGGGAPAYVPSAKLDYEMEMGVWIGPGNALGQPIPIEAAADHVAGLSLFNDWSARDVQAWESQPLGPFLGKNFHSTVSPWIVTAEALAPFRIAQPPRPEGDPAPLPYLLDADDQAAGAFAIELEVCLTTPVMREQGLAPFRLSSAATANMYWTVAQIVAHHTSGGCNLNPGDLLGTGTISGPEQDGFGSLLELTRGGADALTLPTGETRLFLLDGDEVTMSGHAKADGFAPIGFGVCRAMIAPAI